jgi:hypothetical protein
LSKGGAHSFIVVVFVQLIYYKVRKNGHGEAQCLVVLPPTQAAEELRELTSEVGDYLLLFQHRIDPYP